MKRNNIAALSASRDVGLCWIPAFAGMTELMDCLV